MGTSDGQTRPWGVLRTKDLLNAGLLPQGITWRVKKRRLWRMYQGVYAVIPPEHLRVEGRWLAAVYACGEWAALSHLAAAADWDLARAPSGPIDVTVPSTAGRIHRPGIRLHRSRTLTPADVTIHRGIPVTTPARTIADLRRSLPRDRFLSILKAAERRRLNIGPQSEYLPDPDRTELERRFLAVCRRHGIPSPDCQVIIGPYTVDFMWPDQRLIVEVDGWEAHGIRQAFESDRERDAWLSTQGYRVVRFTWRQLRDEPATVVSTLNALLGMRAAA